MFPLSFFRFASISSFDNWAGARTRNVRMQTCMDKKDDSKGGRLEYLARKVVFHFIIPSRRQAERLLSIRTEQEMTGIPFKNVISAEAFTTNNSSHLIFIPALVSMNKRTESLILSLCQVSSSLAYFLNECACIVLYCLHCIHSFIHCITQVGTTGKRKARSLK